MFQAHLQPRSARSIRRPVHTFQVRQKPFIVQPVVIAPVLPGETMNNLMLQARVVSAPVANPLVGWWCEYYFFYVKHRDLDERDTLTAMALDPNSDTSALNSAAKTATYHYGAAPDWTQLCLNRVVDEYFRDEGEIGTTFEVDNMPLAAIVGNSWLDSVTNEAIHTADDVDVDLDADTNIMASEVEKAMRQYQALRMYNLTDMTYEDFLRTYGVSIPQEEELHRPELVRYVRSWSYPSNTIDPATGAPSSALSWSISERADKARFFKEPGWLFGVSVVRPKVYLGSQTGSAASLMADFFTWLPAVYRGELEHALLPVTATGGPLPTVTDNYWVDIRDLLMYGDQFVNFALTETDANIVAVPTAGLQKRFVSNADIQGLFAGTDYLVSQDGICNFNLKTMIRDLTPRTASS